MRSNTESGSGELCNKLDNWHQVVRGSHSSLYTFELKCFCETFKQLMVSQDVVLMSDSVSGRLHSGYYSVLWGPVLYRQGNCVSFKGTLG